MSTEEVINGNKLIAEFIGVKRSSIDKFYYYGDLMYTIPVLHPNVWRLSESELQYHTSWDWLMPVVEKIEGLGFRFKQCRRRVEIEKDFPVGIRAPIDARITIQKHETKILSAWYAVTQFILYYNQNSTQTKQ